MAKVQHIFGISKRIPFEGFDFYDLFRITFESSELGRVKRLLPLHEMAVNFGLVSKRPGRKRGPKPFFSPEGKVAGSLTCSALPGAASWVSSAQPSSEPSPSSGLPR